MWNRKCELCESRTTEYLDRCNGCLYIQYHLEERIEKAVEDFDGDTSYTDLITCPYCGSENGDSWETRESGDITCSRCDNEFYVEIDVTVTYSTSKCEPASRLPFAREG